MTKPSDDQNAVAAFWRNNSGHCVSGLVAALAGGMDGIDSHDSLGRRSDALYNLSSLCEKASELCSPIDDWEEAAREFGWKQEEDGERWFKPDAQYDDDIEWANSAQDAVENHEGAEPYQWEILEHWIVDQWLAEKLQAKGERIDMDFEGLCVWGRTCTGQAVSLDSVICAIYDELHADDRRAASTIPEKR